MSKLTNYPPPWRAEREAMPLDSDVVNRHIPSMTAESQEVIECIYPTSPFEGWPRNRTLRSTVCLRRNRVHKDVRLRFGSGTPRLTGLGANAILG